MRARTAATATLPLAICNHPHGACVVQAALRWSRPLRYHGVQLLALGFQGPRTAGARGGRRVAGAGGHRRAGGCVMAGGWIDVSSVSRLGEVGAFYFIVRTVLAGRERLVVRDTPAFTNRSLEPKLHGWCGETNNMATFAMASCARRRWRPVAAGVVRRRWARLGWLRCVPWSYGYALGCRCPRPAGVALHHAPCDAMPMVRRDRAALHRPPVHEPPGVSTPWAFLRSSGRWRCGWQATRAGRGMPPATALAKGGAQACWCSRRWRRGARCATALLSGLSAAHPRHVRGAGGHSAYTCHAARVVRVRVQVRRLGFPTGQVRAEATT